MIWPCWRRFSKMDPRADPRSVTIRPAPPCGPRGGLITHSLSFQASQLRCSGVAYAAEAHRHLHPSPFFGFKIRLQNLSSFFRFFFGFSAQTPPQMEAKSSPKSDFWLLFGRSVGEHVFGSISFRFCGCFLQPEPLKTMVFP